MPATRAAAERHYTEEPDDARGVMCPECEGTGDVCIDGWSPWTCDEFATCPRCNGTGAIDAWRAAEDAADDYDDLLTELRADREAGR